MTDFTNIVRARVAQLAALDPQRTVFGASKHGYRFAEPYPEERLTSFERSIGVTLPEDYRAFITRVGNGGAGPSYGVLGFQAKESEDFTAYDALGQSWAYAEQHNPTDLLHYGDGKHPPDAENDDGECTDEEAERRRQLYWEACDSTGALYLCHHGCASRSLLVVSGPCRGQIWSDEVAHDGGYAPELTPSGEPHDFRSWYLAWLDKSFALLHGSSS